MILRATSQHYSIYKPYYEAYATSRMYGNQVNNTNIVIPETYYNIRAKNGYLSYESQQVIERNTGNIINSEYYYNGGYRIPYDGVKRASNYLTSLGLNRTERKEILQSFEVGTIQVRQSGMHEYGIRYFDVLNSNSRGAKVMGQYLNNTFTPLTNRANLALPPEWNKAYYIQQWQVKPETVMLTGKVGPQLTYGTQYVGGANQIFVYRPWENNSLVMPDW